MSRAGGPAQGGVGESGVPPRQVLKALLTNPLGPGTDRAQDLLDALLEENGAHLPRFSPSG